MPTLIESPEAMHAHGRACADAAVNGMVVALVGNMGAGKTHWTQGFVQGIGSAANVTSPTFGLVHEYNGGRLPVFHFDFHRVDSQDDLLAIGWDDYLDRDGLIVVEWADKFPALIPATAKWIRISASEQGTRLLFE